MDNYKQEFEEGSSDSNRKRLREVLNKCTEGQQNIFNRMYGSIETIPEDKMSWAYSQVMRTLNKQRKE